MKNFSLLLLSFSILFQSCFTYKTVDYNSIPIEKKQKVEVKGVGGTNIQGTLVSKNEQTMIVDNNGQLQKIPVNEIYEVKVRKFSIIKLARGIGGSVVAYFALGILALASFSL